MNEILLLVALAQTPAGPKDSVPKDSQPRVLGPCWELCVGVAMAAAAAVSLAAPSAFLLLKGTQWQHSEGVGFSDDHVFGYVAGGVSGEMPGNGSVQGGELDVLNGHLYGGFRVEQYYLTKLGNYEYASLRAGYVIHPWPSALGGITIGYRRAHGDSVQNAVEIGFPLIAGRRNGWLRLEPIYLFSNRGTTWTYRGQFEWAIARTPLLAGFYLEVKPVRQDGEYFVMPALVLGMRF